MIRWLTLRSGLRPSLRLSQRRRRDDAVDLLIGPPQTRGIRSRRLPADAAVRASVVVCQAPLVQHVPGLVEPNEQLPIEQLTTGLDRPSPTIIMLGNC